MTQNQTVQHSHLDVQDNISTCVGVHIRYNKIPHEFPMHDHGFHELVLVLEGRCNHYINGRVLPINGNVLMFVRDKDIHTYSDYSSGLFEYYTAAIDYNFAKDIFCFLGKGFDHTPLFEAEMPPTVALSQHNAEKIGNTFAKLFMLMNTDHELLATEAKIMFVNILSDHFRYNDKKESNIPSWLENAYISMQSPRNFTLGAERFFELCGKSREHCTREFSRHYHQSPSDYVNLLRMSHAVNLLKSSRLSVSDIALECGFVSISGFYSRFENEFGITPSDYRKGTLSPKNNN